MPVNIAPKWLGAATAPLKRVFLNCSGRLAFERALRQAIPVLVYQMGKVGSSSVRWSLLQQYPGAALHLHFFAPDHPDYQVRRLYRWAIAERRPVNVISLTREPIGRNVSAFFQNFKRDTGVPFAQSTFSLRELRTLFLSKARHDTPLVWFDRHTFRHFGIDVFETPFPESGVALYTRHNVRLLVLRSELADDQKEAAIREFLALPGFKLQNFNVGAQKEYAATYKAFRAQVTLPPDYVERMCQSKYFNHFYDRTTINAVRQRWLEPEPNLPTINAPAQTAAQASARAGRPDPGHARPLPVGR
ncbi:MAG TPA: putative capsular polysaccharide synthesis family protein [Clostridia bacterium]|nr:putative capsular polysaccharide synthesis family protein [Clostridia bacterium]